MPLSWNKRELDKTAEEKWERRKAGDPAAPAPSSMRPSAKLKRSRMEYAAMDQSDPVRTKDLDLGALAGECKIYGGTLLECSAPRFMISEITGGAPMLFLICASSVWSESLRSALL